MSTNIFVEIPLNIHQMPRSVLPDVNFCSLRYLQLVHTSSRNIYPVSKLEKYTLCIYCVHIHLVYYNITFSYNTVLVCSGQNRETFHKCLCQSHVCLVHKLQRGCRSCCMCVSPHILTRVSMIKTGPFNNDENEKHWNLIFNGDWTVMRGRNKLIFNF